MVHPSVDIFFFKIIQAYSTHHARGYQLTVSSGFNCTEKPNPFELQITELVLEVDEKKTTERKPDTSHRNAGAFSFVKNICQTTPLFRQPLLNKFILVIVIDFCALLGWDFWIFEFFLAHFDHHLLLDLQSQYSATVATSTICYGRRFWKSANIWRHWQWSM